VQAFENWSERFSDLPRLKDNVLEDAQNAELKVDSFLD
jgi:hypothetical protein